MSEYTTDQILDMIEALGDPSKLDLSGKDLSYIDLSRETIQQKYKERGWPKADKEPPWYSSLTNGACLTEANLQGAFLRKANLQGADLWRANLQGADLEGANLQGADLREAKLQGTYLKDANLQGVELFNANLQGANLGDANLQGADLSLASLHGAFLWGADLQGARFSYANLQGAHLSNANLQGAHLSNANLREVDMETAQSLEGAYFDGALLHLSRLQAERIKQVGEEKARRYLAAQSAYLGLKVNFKEIGYYDDARWAYLKERAMERKSHPWYSPNWIWSWIQNIFTGYIERTWVIVLWLVLWPAIFTLLYGWLGGITNNPGYAPPQFPWDYLFFSLRTMITLAYSDFTPIGIGQWLAPLEGALGIIFLALLGFSVAKRITRD